MESGHVPVLQIYLDADNFDTPQLRAINTLHGKPEKHSFVTTSVDYVLSDALATNHRAKYAGVMRAGGYEPTQAVDAHLVLRNLAQKTLITDRNLINVGKITAAIEPLKGEIGKVLALIRSAEKLPLHSKKRIRSSSKV